jgi:hypothetical protein
MRVRMRVPMVIMHSIVRMHVHKSIVTTEAWSCLPYRRRLCRLFCAAMSTRAGILALPPGRHFQHLNVTTESN